MIILPPEQVQILQSLFTLTAQASVDLGIPENRIESFLTQAFDFVRRNYKQLDNHQYFLVLSDDCPSKPVIDCKAIITNINKDKPIFYIDEELRLAKIVSDGVRTKDCQDRTKNEARLGLLVAGTYVWIFLKGTILEETDVLKQRSGPPRLSRFARPISEFDSILEDHREHCIAGERSIRYWKDKTERILLSEPDGTEEIFRRSLFVWLWDNVSDKLKVYADATGVGQDKTDITIVTINGTYVVEIKWLGKNANTRYNEQRINEGLVQVGIYLNNDGEIICGHLVIYDGRSLQDHKAKSNWDSSLIHERCSSPKIIYLDTESPSKAATRIVREKAR